MTERTTTVTTPAAPGAVAIIQLHGPGVESLLTAVTGVDHWPVSQLRLVQFCEIDEGLAVLLRGGEHGWAQLMPHGGTRVVQRLVNRLAELGARYAPEPSSRELYPEAGSDLEADVLATLAQAASPAAIDLLLEQPLLWREKFRTRSPGLSADGLSGEEKQRILSRSLVLDRLVSPPSVAFVGRPNVGKSTLANRFLGDAASVVADLPGTTRDWVAGLAQIGGVTVRWLDTPGLRVSDDPIETRAIELAAVAIRSADVIVAVRDPDLDWPTLEELPRVPDVWVMNKADRLPTGAPGPVGRGTMTPLYVSAETGEGLPSLESAILLALGLAPPLPPEPWAFSARLREWLASGDVRSMRDYVKPRIAPTLSLEGGGDAV